MVPELQERISRSSQEELNVIADLVGFFQHCCPTSVTLTRSDEVAESLKSVIVDWITPPGKFLLPALSRTTKSDRGFQHERTGFLLCPAGLDWGDDEYARHLHSNDCPSLTGALG
jgi:hypothetical protein